MCAYDLLRRVHDLQWRVLFETTQPVFLGDNLTALVGEGLVKLVVIGELEFRKDLVYSIDMVELGAIVEVTRGFTDLLGGNRSCATLPSFGLRCAGIFP